MHKIAIKIAKVEPETKSAHVVQIDSWHWRFNVANLLKFLINSKVLELNIELSNNQSIRSCAFLHSG